MGQVLVVQGRDRDALRDVHDRAVALFGVVHGLRAEASVDVGETRAVRFPRTLVPGPAMHRDAASGDWAMSAGTWIAHGAGNGPAALRRIGAALVEDGTALSLAAQRLDGYFVVVAGCGRTGEVGILTDRIGALHAYHATVGGCLVVATSALVLAALLGAETDPVAVRELLAAHSVFDERSLWRGVEKLPAASVVRLRDGAIVSRRRWWTPADASWDRASVPATPQDLADALVRSVESALAAHPRACFDLTGGFDSRILVGAALRTGLPFATVVNGQPDDENVVAANRIAAAFSLDHRNQVPGRDFPFPEMADFEAACALGDGEANVLDYAPTMLAHRNLARSFDLAVNGSFGEVCRGYWWDVLGARLWSRSRFDARRVALARFASETWVDRVTRGRFDGTVADHFTGVVERAVADLAGAPDTAKVDAVYLRVRMQRWHGRIASLVARTRPTVAPFAFREPLETALRMTPRTRWAGRVAREVVELLDRRLAAMPLANGAPATPIRVTNAHRHGAHFAELAGRAGRSLRRAARLPVAAPPAPRVWRAGDVWRLPELSDLLRVESMRTRDFYDERELRRLVEETRAARAAPAATLGRVVTLELAVRAVANARAAVHVRS